MKLTPLVFILFSVCCSAVAQILLKQGMSQPGVQQMIQTGFLQLSSIRILFDPWVFGGLALYGAGALVWLAALARVEVSFAYPFVGLGFILVMILGYLFFDDNIGATRITGTALVVLGIALISRSQVA
jgi:multidrug transporter EmrE-like cation transporter